MSKPLPNTPTMSHERSCVWAAKVAWEFPKYYVLIVLAQIPARFDVCLSACLVVCLFVRPGFFFQHMFEIV